MKSVPLKTPSGPEIDQHVRDLQAFYGVPRTTPLYVGDHLWRELQRLGADMSNFRRNTLIPTETK